MAGCARCGHDNPDEARFCMACGSPLAAAAPPRVEERKLVSVLFADLVGFTARSEQLDPEDVRAVLSPYYVRLRSELERFGGTVEKFIGDAVMAVFGAPVAHEDDPERAVRAALAIRDWVEKQHGLNVRIAIATGEALVTLGARPGEGEGMAAGDVVNTAARLQSSAPVNGILVSERTYRATRPVIAYRDAEPVTAKGKAEPVAVWEVVDAISRLGVDLEAAGTELVGREGELAMLRDALARARHQGRVQLVTVVGVPGIGKSRLVHELGLVVDGDPDLIRWRQGRSLPYGEGVAYWALGEMVKAEAGILESDPADEVEAKLTTAVAAVMPDSEEAVRVQAHLRPLVGLAGDAAPGDERGARRRFFEAMAEQSPLVLVFEDLHWADDALLDFVDHLVDWATGVPLLVVCTTRPELFERRRAWGGGKRNALTVSLAPLTEADTERLIGALVARATLPAGSRSALLAQVGGNPLYTEQFVRMLLERGGEDLALPENVQGIIAARLDALPGEEKALLHAAAVFGKVFWLGAVVSLNGDAAGVEARLHDLERKEFIRRQRRSSVGGETEYAFQHTLVHDVAYGQLPRAARAEKHLQAAGWIESLGRSADHADMLAHHYSSAAELNRSAGRPTPEVDERARRALTEAGDRAMALGASAAAVPYYERALAACPPGDAERAVLLLRLGRSRRDDAGFDDALLEEACDGLVARGDLAGAAEAQLLLARVWWNRGSEERLVAAHLGRAQALLPEGGAEPLWVEILSESARLAMLAGAHARSVETATQALAMAEELERADLTCELMITRGASLGMLGDPGGIAEIERAGAIAREARLPMVEWRVAVNLSAQWFERGDVRAATEAQLRAGRLAKEHGGAAERRWSQSEEPTYHFLAGDWASAEAALRAAFEDGGDHYLDAIRHDIRARIRRARGDLDGALADSGRQLVRNREIEDLQNLLPALGLHAHMLADAGDAAGARGLCEELLARWRAGGRAGGGMAPADAAWAATAAGAPAGLLEVLDTSTLSRWAAAGAAMLRGDYVAAAGLFHRIGSPLDEARARLRAAEQLEGAERAEQLRRARAFFEQVGATAYVRECDAMTALR